MSKQMLELAKGLREAAHYCTELSELEKHCNDIAGKLDSMARQCSAESETPAGYVPLSKADDSKGEVLWREAFAAKWRDRDVWKGFDLMPLYTRPAPSASATPGAASDVDEMIERMNRALAKADLEAERADNIENELEALKAGRVPSASVREALEFYNCAWISTPNKLYGGLEWRPKEELLEDCGNRAGAALAALSEPAPALDCDANLPTANDVRGILGPAPINPPQAARVAVDRDLLRRILGYARNASCPFSGQPEVENWHSRSDADCRYLDAILSAPDWPQSQAVNAPALNVKSICESTKDRRCIEVWLAEPATAADRDALTAALTRPQCGGDE